MYKGVMMIGAVIIICVFVCVCGEPREIDYDDRRKRWTEEILESY